MIGHLATFVGVTTTILAACPSDSGWRLTRQDEEPKVFAVTGPTSTNLNVASVALVCEELDGKKSLQLQIYPSNQEPILPRGASRKAMKEDPSVEIIVDGQTFPVIPGFAGDYAILMEREEDSLPILSERLLDAMQSGRTMIVRFDLLREGVGRKREFDGELVVDLEAGDGSAAIAAVRQDCKPR
jgi:hypothetical protein